eukprot:3560825-Rhodomonas_salina.4
MSGKGGRVGGCLRGRGSGGAGETREGTSDRPRGGASGESDGWRRGTLRGAEEERGLRGGV